MVPMSPVPRPAAWSAATARYEVVVLPSVPVMPTTVNACEGSPNDQAAALASAARASTTTIWGTATPGTARSTRTATAPASTAANA